MSQRKKPIQEQQSQKMTAAEIRTLNIFVFYSIAMIASAVGSYFLGKNVLFKSSIILYLIVKFWVIFIYKLIN